MRDERTNEQHRAPANQGNQRDVVSADELRDNTAVRGRVTEEYTVPPEAPVRRDTMVAQQPRRAPMPGHRDDVEIPEAYNLDRDRVRWGPIMAGLVTAVTTLLLLSVLGLAVGLTAVDAERAATEGGIPLGTGIGTAIWGALSALLAFGLGGWVAGHTAAIFDRGWGALNGALVFLVAVPLILFLATAGIGGVLGTLGNYASGLNIDPARIQQQVDQTTGQAQQQAGQATPQQVGQAAENARNGAWGALTGLVLGLAASAIGGMAGVRRKLTVDTTDGQRRIVE